MSGEPERDEDPRSTVHGGDWLVCPCCEGRGHVHDVACPLCINHSGVVHRMTYLKLLAQYEHRWKVIEVYRRRVESVVVYREVDFLHGVG